MVLLGAEVIITYIEDQNKCSMKCHRSQEEISQLWEGDLVSCNKVTLLNTWNKLSFVNETTTEKNFRKIYEILWNTYFGLRSILVII